MELRPLQGMGCFPVIKEGSFDPACGKAADRIRGSLMFYCMAGDRPFRQMIILR